jgi:hypothetical protein
MQGEENMTQDEIIEMLRASCDKDRVDPEQNGFWVIVTDELVAFAKLVAEHERDRIKQANASEIERVNTHIKELQGQIETLHAMYELATKQRDYLMEQQNAQVAAMRGKMQ